MNFDTTGLREAGIRKAAILVASLERSAADALLNQLSPEQADLVRQAATADDRIDPQERQRVIDEFRRIGPMVPGQCPAGIELSGLSEVVPDVKPRPVVAPPTATTGRGFTSDAPPFDFLREAEDQRLAHLLGGERPQTVALVLSHLPPERAGEVLAHFAPSLQVDVVRRLVDLENTDPQILREVERALEVRWSRQFAVERRRAAGPQSVAKILAACDPPMRERILENLAAHDQPLAEQFGRQPIDFEDLVRFEDAALLAVFRAAEPEVVQAALVGAPPTLVERFLRRMPSEESKSLRHKLDHPGPIRLSDVEDARRRIAALAQRMLLAAPPGSSSRPSTSPHCDEGAFSDGGNVLELELEDAA